MRKIVLLGAVAIAAAPVLALATDVGVGHVRGGIVNAFAFDGANAAIYAGVHGAGLFKSTNDGVSWAQIFLPSISSHFSEAVASTGGTVLVGEGAPSSAAIWTSHDGAASFTNALSVGAGYEAIAF